MFSVPRPVPRDWKVRYQQQHSHRDVLLPERDLIPWHHVGLHIRSKLRIQKGTTIYIYACIALEVCSF